jgi:glutathione-regulated potassium-efflux system ancillary protein KefG
MSQPCRILVLFAHPAFHKSRVQRGLAQVAREMDGVTFHDLYEEYYDFQLDVAREQRLLAEHDLIVFQHPFYWYSSPAILKEWQDLVLEYGFAYGEGGTALHGKRMLSVLTAGGPEHAYSAQGSNFFTVRQLLAPFEQTAKLCGMEYLPPFIVHGTHALSGAEIDSHAADYRRVLTTLRDNTLDWDRARNLHRLNADLATLIPVSAPATVE